MPGTVREYELKTFVNEEKRFIGHAQRHTPVYRGDEIVAQAMLVAPLYVEKDGKFVYVDHAWIQMPTHLLQMQKYIFDFTGIVKNRGDKNSKVYIAFKEINTITKFKKEYEGMSMISVDMKDEKNIGERKEKFLNHSVITAYELGQELPKNKIHGDGTSEYLSLMMSIRQGRHMNTKRKGKPQARKARASNDTVPD